MLHKVKIYLQIKMDFSVLNLVLLVWIVTKYSTSFPTENPATLMEKTTKPIQHLVEMGKGIEEIPEGNSHIKSINFAYNHLEILPSFVFRNKSYKNLHKIELYQNKINNISLNAFRDLRQLKFVDLSQNNVTSMDSYTFKTNNKLEKLDLSGNRINFHYEKIFLQSQSLEVLLLADNKIEQIFEFTFVGLPNLKHLFLDNNIVFTISIHSFVPLNQLQTLSLANTGVHRLSENMFKTLPRSLDLTETPLSKRFYPALKKLNNDAVNKLIYIDKYIDSDVLV